MKCADWKPSVSSWDLIIPLPEWLCLFAGEAPGWTWAQWKYITDERNEYLLEFIRLGWPYAKLEWADGQMFVVVPGVTSAQGEKDALRRVRDCVADFGKRIDEGYGLKEWMAWAKVRKSIAQK